MFQWIIGALLVMPCCAVFATTQITVASAASFHAVLQQLAKTYEKTHPVTIQISSASTGKLTTQIQQGAPFDLFFAADSAHPQLLVEQGYAQESSRKTYVRGQMVYVHQKASAQETLYSTLLGNPQTKIAIANPRYAPYGIAAKSVLETLTLWPNLQARLVTAQNAEQALLYLDQGVVAGAFIAQAQYLALPNPARFQKYAFSDQDYPAMKQQVVILNRSAKRDDVMAFYAYMLSEPVLKQYQIFGYLLDK